LCCVGDAARDTRPPAVTLPYLDRLSRPHLFWWHMQQTLGVEEGVERARHTIIIVAGDEEGQTERVMTTFRDVMTSNAFGPLLE
jgi:hypothetical protein